MLCYYLQPLVLATVIKRSQSRSFTPPASLNPLDDESLWGGLSFLVSARILMMRLARRSRRRRAELSVTPRRYISRTCWAAVNESIRLDKSARGREPEEMAGDGAKCLGWERAKWYSRWRSCWVISRYSKVMCGRL